MHTFPQDTGDITMDVDNLDDVLDSLCTHNQKEVTYSSMLGLICRQRPQVDLGQVNRTKRGPLIHISHQRLRNLDANRALRLLRAPANMRREDEILQPPEIRAPRVQVVVEVVAVARGLVGIHVQRGAGDLAGPRRVDERGDVDDAAAAGVDEVASVLHVRELLLADQVLGLGDLGDVQGDEVGGAEEGFERGHLPGGSHGHQVDHVVVDHIHAHGLCEDGELRADVAVANDA